MSESDQPKRGRGRPRVNPIERNRRNVTLQVNNELYEALKAASVQSGVSISREMEQRVKNSFTQRDIITAAAEGAAQAATSRMDEQYTAFFGGRDGMFWAKAAADAYQAVVLDLITEMSLKAPDEINEDFRIALVERMKERQFEISLLWYNQLMLSNFMSIDLTSENPNVFKSQIENNPFLKALLDENVMKYFREHKNKKLE